MAANLCDLVCVKDFEEAAARVLPRTILDFYRSGATTEHTLRENQEAIKRWYIRPRFLNDVSKCDLSTTILGHQVSVPFGVAPMGIQSMAHPEGECASARAAAKIGTLFTLSTAATSSIEEIAHDNPLRFFQLYIYKDREVTVQLVRRAEKCNYKALVLTVDAPSLGIRYADLRNRFKIPPHLRYKNFPIESELSKGACVSKEGSALDAYVASHFDTSLTWKDVSWLKSITSLPIILKGILSGEDAVKGIDSGASAIWVSNHGGRQLDGVLPTIEALPEVIAAVGERCEVYVDGGFQTGTDIFKALAIGAKMVFIGRPLIWGLACGGFDGALKVLNVLKQELHSTMTLSGFSHTKDITSEAILRKTHAKL